MEDVFPDLNCALFLWRLHVFNGFNVSSIDELMSVLERTPKGLPLRLAVSSSLSASKSLWDFNQTYVNNNDMENLMICSIIWADFIFISMALAILLQFAKKFGNCVVQPSFLPFEASRFIIFSLKDYKSS